MKAAQGDSSSTRPSQYGTKINLRRQLGKYGKKSTHMENQRERTRKRVVPLVTMNEMGELMGGGEGMGEGEGASRHSKSNYL